MWRLLRILTTFKRYENDFGSENNSIYVYIFGRFENVQMIWRNSFNKIWSILFKMTWYEFRVVNYDLKVSDHTSNRFVTWIILCNRFFQMNLFSLDIVRLDSLLKVMVFLPSSFIFDYRNMHDDCINQTWW